MTIRLLITVNFPSNVFLPPSRKIRKTSQGYPENYHLPPKYSDSTTSPHRPTTHPPPQRPQSQSHRLLKRQNRTSTQTLQRIRGTLVPHEEQISPRNDAKKFGCHQSESFQHLSRQIKPLTTTPAATL